MHIKALQHDLKNHSIKEYTNWLYENPKVLSQFHVLTGEQVLADLKRVTIHKIDKGYYAGAIASLRKLHDVSQHPDAFYDELTYELIPLELLRKYILDFKFKK